MNPSRLKEFDLSIPAPNGLRRGRTTGSCATAAVKAALYLLLYGERRAQVQIVLPDGEHYLTVPIQHCYKMDEQTARAEVLKDGGDDPDNTHGATIFAEVRKNGQGRLRFFSGEGVGTATQPGLRVPVGEPAINPTPRAMMRLAVLDVTDNDEGYDLIIGCIGGETIAKKTFNPKLGIVGGISILGTSGIVEPLSQASWIASIEVYIRVALGDDTDCIALLPGKIGRVYAKETLELPEHRSVQIANFLGDALDFTQQALAEQQRELDVLWLLGHPGKLAKVLDGVWDTHSGKSGMAMDAVARVAAELDFDNSMVRALEQANTVEAATEILKNQPNGRALWTNIEQRIAELAQARVPNARKVKVRLFNLQGDGLGAA
ncbi:cobalt-precorrin-5B (C(1))-methyltransferase CbiD [Candidatus Methylobacter oryzae]|uniref:Cobalt-precorrin-5B C(1)-methyltransferase n=1 Tax=Candidatus Methylobacter oryzae TaxID=2497749 RepID=A0ABY3CF26_9GAMM|nr:cobalt-precorrin-5B (C(1))-methyltransferase CbiD [Candidatus Methylobacter oryzae]TRX02102.1 cobalamin biosynthesis protein CbiD [Candidatus Methylobacter oryzae]